MANFDLIVNALEENQLAVNETVATLIVRLGSKWEWSMEDNFDTTEEIARLAERVGLPAAGDQTDEGLRFYRGAAQ